MARLLKTRSFVLAYDVPYPGDFYMTGRWWRAVRVVEGRDAADAVSNSGSSMLLPADCEIVVATSYPPAFDVVRSREISRPVS